MNLYPVRRVLDLFHAHEALPHNPVFVLEAIKPLIEAELNAWFNQSAVTWPRGLDLERFEYELTGECRDRLARRALSVIQGFKIVHMGERRTLPMDFEIRYWLMFSPLQAHTLKVRIDFLCQGKRDLIVHRAQQRLHVAVDAIQAHETPNN